MAKSLIDMVATYLGHTREQVLHLSYRAPMTYRRYTIPKKKGGRRLINHPAKQTKSLQYALMNIFLSQLPIHSCAAAYKKKTASEHIPSPLLKNAILHAPYSYSVRIDFTDFFHSISSLDLFNRISNNDINLSISDKEFIENCLFVRVPEGQKGLAIGAPSSPIISNIVMYSLDEQINAIANGISDRVAYSRYADDIIFSTNLRGGCNYFYRAMSELVTRTSSPKLVINRSKTMFSSRASRRVVTGLFIRPDGGTSLGRQNKRYIRKLLFDLKRDNIEPRKLTYLSGYLAFALDVEPDFYNRLAHKYGAELLAVAIGKTHHDVS
ncbi:MAG: RNA-directed DNA polymerase [Phycisphaerae bacterium]|nr:RNA-directed DNA polymerase [Phycisphaerae bacterium]